MKKRLLRVILATPTIHDIVDVLTNQYGEVDVRVLSNKCTIKLTKNAIHKLINTIVHNAKSLERGRYNLVLAGLPLANLIAFDVLKKRFGDLSVLSFDIKKRRYIRVADVGALVDEKCAKTRSCAGGDG
jgi:hypothetical protein